MKKVKARLDIENPSSRAFFLFGCKKVENTLSCKRLPALQMYSEEHKCVIKARTRIIAPTSRYAGNPERMQMQCW